MKRLLLPILALALSSCAQDAIRCADGNKVRMTAVNDGIIHIEAVPDNAGFTSGKSLSVIPQTSFPQDLTVTKDQAVLRTAKLTAVLDRSTGAVSFLDPEGKPIACEERREFSPIEVEGTKGWTVRQVFAPVDGESFYGLGQHQADEWDYKGRNEELYQYNTKISIPFVVSGRGYGILWDSYSFCRWGDPRDYAQLGEVFRLYDQDGVEGALTGTYTPKEGEPLVRRETAIAQEFLRTPECDRVINSPEGFNFNGSSVEYNGFIQPSESGIFRFYIYYAGYTRVFIDGKAVTPEIWRTAWNPNGRKFEVEMKEGEMVPVHIEWKPDGGISYCGLRVLSPVDPQEQAKMSWWGEMQDQIDYYFIYGGDADGVISGYRTLTGKAPIMPKWALGYWQSRERYKTQDEVVGTLKEFRERRIPVDNIVQDWQYWEDDKWGSHEFDTARFPHPEEMVEDIHAMDGRFMISVWPKFYEGTEHFEEMDSHGWIYRTAIDEKVIDWLGYSQSFYDAYSKDARALFWQQMKDHLYPIGVDAWWMDASEPNIHDCTDMDYRKKMCGPTALGPSTKYFNAYALMNAQAIYEGQRASDNRRVFLLTRNGYAGLQRYSTASWSGDIGTRWEDMKAQISAGLNFSISGIPFWGQDIGGFSVENRFAAAQAIFDATGKVTPDLIEWREMQTRWHQWGAFCPLYRAHGQFPLREPWNIAPEGDRSYNAIVETDQFRYRLIPYLYSLAARVYFDDYTLMRPLMMDFAGDSKACGISDQFLCGPAIMVCPVYEYGARQREVYLPEGGWYDLNHDLGYIEGGSTFTAEAPYEFIPLYVRAGQIIPLGPAVQSTAETMNTNLRIQIFAGADAEFRLYEDDGLSYDYENGEFSRITFSWSEDAKTLTIAKREGSFKGMEEVRHFLPILYSKDGSEVGRPVTYDGNEVTIQF